MLNKKEAISFIILGVVLIISLYMLSFLFNALTAYSYDFHLQEIQRLELKKEIALIESQININDLSQELTNWAVNNCGNKSTYVLFYGYEKKWNCLKSQNSYEYVFME